MKKVISAVAAIIALIAAFSPCVCADWYDEIHSGKYTVINKNGFISDTFCGVNAYYNLTDTSVNTYYQCNELVIRFYKEAYGLNVFASFVGGLIMRSEGYEFVTPSVPKPGDVIYAPSKFRRGKGDHWAIVKSYSNGVITLFEQNVRYNGKAGTGRTIQFPSDYYYIYTPVAKAGYPAPVLKNAPPETTEPITAATTTVTETTTVTTTAETVTSTEKPSSATSATVTTTSTTTAKPDSTTTAAAATGKTDGGEETTTAKPATTAPDTTKRSETSAQKTTSSTTQKQETSENPGFAAFQSVEETTSDTAQESSAGATVYTLTFATRATAQPEAQTQKKGDTIVRDRKTVVITAAVLSAVTAAAAALVVSKKRKETGETVE